MTERLFNKGLTDFFRAKRKVVTVLKGLSELYLNVYLFQGIHNYRLGRFLN